MTRYRLGVLVTHPIQYFAPWYRALAAHPSIDLKVFFACRQTPEGQAAAGFDKAFEWDIPLFEGYSHQFLENRAKPADPSLFLGCDTPEIRQIVSSESWDAFLVQGWHSRSYWQAIRACWHSDTPVLVRGDSQLDTRRSLVKRALKYPLYRSVIPTFDGYLVVGQRARTYFQHYGAPEDRLFFVPHCVDNDYFARQRSALSSTRDALREKWGIPKQAVVFLFAGKLLARKRPMDFVEAVARAAAADGRVFGLVTGSGPLERTMRDRVETGGLPIRFTGFLNQSEMSKAYTASDAFVLPSDATETWGLVVNEAMASGLPCLVSEAAGCAPDIVVAGQSGETYPCGDVSTLSQKMVNWTHDASQRQILSAGAQRKIREYSIEKAVQGTVTALEHVVRRKRL